MQIVEKDFVGLIEAVDLGTVSATEVVESYIAQLEKVEPSINGMVQVKFDQTREAAAEADRSPQKSQLRGLPFALKDCLEVENWVTTFGTKGYADHVSTYSATVVRRFEAAGACLLGITNSPELGTSIETDNLVYGRTNNPIDLDRAPGGSSGGGATLLKAKAIPFVIGSDFGGGSRNTAHCCGVFAHRPSFGRVSTAGYLFGCSGLKRQMCRIAPLARSVRDLELIFRVIAGADRDDPKTDGASAVSSVAPIDGVRIALTHGCPIAPPDNQTVEAVEQFGMALARMSQVSWPNLDTLFAEGFGIVRALFTADAGRLLAGSLETVAGTTEVSPSMAFWLETVSACAELSASELIVLLSRWEAFRLTVNRLFEHFDFLVVPTAPSVAPRHGETLEESAFWSAIAYTAPLSLTEAPVVVVPVGIGKDGLPVTVQIVARKGEDERLLGFCRWLHDSPGTPQELIDSALAVPTVFD